MKLESRQQKKGYALYTAIILTGILLLAAYATADISSKELLLNSAEADSHTAFYNADTGLECALYWDLQDGASGAFGSNADSINCNGQTISTGSQTVNTNPSQQSVIGGVGGSSDTVWVDDAVPAGATATGDGGDSWNWISSNPAPFSGSLANQSNIGSGEHQHYFYGASPAFSINSNDTLIAYVYIDPSNPPTEIEVQWNSTEQGWNHRAFWDNSGTDLIGWGTKGTSNLQYMGSLPASGRWVELQVPASIVGLGGLHVNGVALTLYDGRVTWDHIGLAGSGGGSGSSIFQLNLTNGCAIVQVSKSGNTTSIQSRGYNSCSGSNRLERGVEVSY